LLILLVLLVALPIAAGTRIGGISLPISGCTR
jgi:hypothetical protein